MTDHARQCWKLSSISFIVLSVIYIYVPALRKPLINEDNFLEMITALMYLAVSFLAIKFLIKRDSTGHRWVDWLVPSLAIFGFAEEVSLSRLFFSESPLIQGVKIDALHDFLRVLLNVLQSGEQRVLVFSIAAGTVLAALVVVLLLRHQIVRLLDYEPFRFCVLWFAFIGVASIADLHLISHFYMGFVEEFSETLAALCLVFGYRSLKSLSAAEDPAEGRTSDAQAHLGNASQLPKA